MENGLTMKRDKRIRTMKKNSGGRILTNKKQRDKMLPATVIGRPV